MMSEEVHEKVPSPRDETRERLPSEENGATNDSPNGSKADYEHLEIVGTVSRVPESPNYYEKRGLRTEGDGMDHTHYNTGSVGFIMTILGCSFALCGSQIVPLLYLTLGTTVANDLDAPQLQIWMFTAILVAMGAIAPFVGPIADLFGRKPSFVTGLLLAILGSIVCAVTPTAGGFIVGQVLLGFGAVMQELLSIAIVGESVPTSKRSLYAALILCTIIPWSPGTLYANWMAAHTWRWIGCAIALWNFITVIMIMIWYRPPPRVNSIGLTRREMFKRIDFVGGAMITIGLVFLLIALNWGGQMYAWKSSHVLSFLILGLLIMVGFAFWEAFGARYPLYPRRIIHAPRPFFCLLFVIFAAGINYMPLVVFWPIESVSVFGSGHHQLGINTLPIGTCILGGAILSALLLGIFKRHAMWVMLTFCLMQTIASACLTLIDSNNIKTAWAPLVFALIGVGGVLVPNQVIITIITPDDLIASATALTVGLRAQAQVVGLAIFYNRFKHEVESRAVAGLGVQLVLAGLTDISVITDFVTELTAVPFDTLAKTLPELVPGTAAYEACKMAAVELFASSFRLVYFITIAFGVSACIAAASMGDISQFLDNHVAVVLD